MFAIRVVGCGQLALLGALAVNCQTDDGNYVFGDETGGTAGSAGTAGNGGTGGKGSAGSPNGGRGGGGASIFGGSGPVSAGMGGEGGEPPTLQGGSGGDEPSVEPPIEPPPGAGAACTGDEGCNDAPCVDGVCCENDCTEACHACAGALTGQADGLCAPVLAGEDPDDDCEDETGSDVCGNDGTCNGEGECRKVGAGQVCAEPSCSGKTFTPAATCDGDGACATPTTEDCGQYPCAATGCSKSCSSQGDCSATSYCNLATNTCAAKLPNGSAATEGYECQSGVVADGVCCNMACTGCKACSGAPLTSGLAGTCLNVVAGQDAHDFCDDSGEACGTDGACDGAGACRSTPRQGEACTTNPANLCLQGGTCNAGSCTGETTKSCPAPTMQCRAAGVCQPSSGTCTHEPTSSGSCNDNNACTTSDHCQDGACTGTAMVCNSPGPCYTTAGATCAGGACDYPTTRADGQSDTKCPSGKQLCWSGNCVQCLTNANCSLPRPSCNTSTHACVCAIPNGSNLLKNPGFDAWTGDIPTNWQLIEFSNGNKAITDSQDCPESGALSTFSGGPMQCVRVTARQRYRAGGYFRGNAGGGGLQVRFYTNTNCAEAGLTGDIVMLGMPSGAGSGFTKHSGLADAPGDAVSARISFDGTDWQFDRMFFGLSSALSDF